jgi:hypothetical protein
MRPRFFVPLAAVALGLFQTSCHKAPPETEPPLQAGCNPLSGAADEDCLLPYPSSFFTVADTTAPTGVRVALPGSLLPANDKGVRFDATLLNGQDGFSAATTLLAYFPTRVDPTNLPGPGDVAASVGKDSPAQILRFDTLERVPLFAEVDENAQPAQRQALILHPVVRLSPSTRYVAVLQHLQAEGGGETPPLSGFRALRDNITAPGSPRYPERARYEEIFTALQSAGLDRSALTLAWDFTTASDEGISGRLVKMRDQAMSYQGSGPPPPPVTFTTVTETPPSLPDLQRQITGTFTVPSFLTEDTMGGIDFGPDGQPQIRGFGQFPLAINVPACAQTAKLPLPVMIFGHGSYNTAANEMSTPYEREIINRLCMVQVGTDWIGRAAGDAAFFLFTVIYEASNIHIPTERLQQAHVNVLALARLLRGGSLSSMPELMLNGQPLIDSSRVYFYGISEGGIQGGTFLALTPDVSRGALNVPCGFWSMFFWRSSDFQPVLPLMQQTYADPIDLQVLLAATQPLWDYTDPATYAAHLLHDPLPGSMPKSILYQEGINDASVPNQNTRAMVRSIGLTLLTPSVEAVYGVDASAGPLGSAYTQFDTNALPSDGGTGVPPMVTPVHDTIRTLEPVKQQIQLFLIEGGQVQDTCGGKPCLNITQ